jgi:hypothetical protein
MDRQEKRYKLTKMKLQISGDVSGPVCQRENVSLTRRTPSVPEE